MPTFIGIDLAWRSERNNTGAVALTGDRDGAELVAVSDAIRSLEEVRAFLNAHGADETVVAIDAPLIIENLTGQRGPCETAVGRGLTVEERFLVTPRTAVCIPKPRLRGHGLKAHEDKLDAFFCAYLAYYFWYWRSDRVELFGDVTWGYIANPKLQPGGIISYARSQGSLTASAQPLS